MKKINLIILLLISSISAFAQINFKQVLPPSSAPQIIPVFTEADEGSLAYADVDGDGSLDVLITGSDNTDQLIAKLYINDGTGNYTVASGTPFVGVKESSVAFADVDNDGDQDVLIAGLDGSTTPTTKLYTNDGFGVFTEVTGTLFDGLRESSIAFSDVEGNGSQDVMITGRNAASQLVSTLYLNNGSGVFSPTNAANTATVAKVNKGAIAFSDVDNDDFEDLLVTGFNTLGAPIAELYLNDQSGKFTKVAGMPFTGVRNSAIAFADVNDDDFVDVLITGFNSSNQPSSNLYLNDENTSFTLSSSTFDGVGNSSIDFSDIDGDGFPEVLITGINSGSQPLTKLYANNGSGDFAAVSGTPFDNVRNSAIAFIDFDGDEKEDVLITGTNNASLAIAKMYANDGSGNFTLATGSPFTGVRNSAQAFADVDDDGDLDVLISGRNSANESITTLFLNDGDGIFTEKTGTPFDGIENGDIAFADIDNDGDQDVLIVGVTIDFPKGYVGKLYTNDGSGNFTIVNGTPFVGLEKSDIAFADVNDDGFQDVFVTGFNLSNVKFSKLYINNAAGNFTEDIINTFEGVRDGAIAFADVDGATGIDLLITGRNTSDDPVANLYLNNGSGVFSLAAGTPFDPVTNSAIAFAEFNGTAGIDVLITGLNGSSERIAKLYTNDGSGTFTLATTPFTGVDNGAVAIADIDENGSQDVIITGDDGSEKISTLYTNNGSGVFTAQDNLPFDGVSASDVSFAEIDGDNLPDLLITGINNVDLPSAKLFRNTTDFIPPNITSAATVSTEENITSTGYIPTADEAVDFSLGTTKDEGLFRIVAGVITFKNAPDFEAPSDADENNIYLVDLIATDQGNNTDVLEVAITVTDVDDTDPTITSAATASVEENTSGTIYTATADEAVTFSLGSSKDEALFTLETAALSFNTAPDFETPLDANADNIYLLDIIATDAAGNSSTLALAITVTDLSDAGPIFTSAATASVAENTTGTVYTATVDGTATFTLGTSKDESFFTITSGAISFTAAPDFETPLDDNTDNIYQIDVIATDENGSSTLAVAITVTDIEEAGPVITSAASATVEENVTGTVYTITADVEATFSLGTTKDEALFTLTDDAISFLSSPNFEIPVDENADNSYLLDIIATDGNGIATTKAITINVTDVEEAGPVITSAASASVEENTTGVIYTATADESVTFILGSSKDEALFTLATDAISFTAAPDFETPLDADVNNIYLIDLLAIDNEGNTTVKEVAITVTDLDEVAPTITSEKTASIEENTTATVYTATADEAVTFTLGSDKDESFFTLSTDAISFTVAPDFETPLDANADNVYLVDIIATDAAGNTGRLEVAISVTNIDEPGPVITSSASVTVEENVTTTVYTITSDVTASYSLDSSKDEALFTLTIDAIRFTNAPDFETPLDADANNVYLLDVIATDANGIATTKAISITVTDAEETPLANKKERLFELYPNPVKNTLYVRPVKITKDAYIQILDITGRLQKSLKYNGQEQAIDVSELSAGVYIIRVFAKSGKMQLKFVKE